MTEAVATTPSHAADGGSIATRFGDLSVDPEKVITFDRGLYGLEHQHRFMLTSVSGWPDIFKLLQSVDDPGLSMIVLPLDMDDGAIDAADFAQACDALSYDPETTLAIGIVTMRQDVQGQAFTVNLKAPLLIDSVNRRGHQHVFTSEKYRLRQALPADGPVGA